MINPRCLRPTLAALTLLAIGSAARPAEAAPAKKQRVVTSLQNLAFHAAAVARTPRRPI